MQLKTSSAHTADVHPHRNHHYSPSFARLKLWNETALVMDTADFDLWQMILNLCGLLYIGRYKLRAYGQRALCWTICLALTSKPIMFTGLVYQ